MSGIFVNYRTDDVAGVAILLDEKLCERFGPERVFRDSRSIGLGLDFRPELGGRLAKSTVFLVVVGPRWLARSDGGLRRVDDPDDFVRREIRMALGIGLHVVPVLVGDTPKLRAGDLPDDIADLAHRQYRRLSDRGMQRELPLLVEDIATILNAEERPGPPSPRRPVKVPAAQSGLGTVVILRPHPLDRATAAPHLAALKEAVELAAADADVVCAETVERPFGLTVVVPAVVAPIRVVSGFLMSLESALAMGCAPDGSQLRATAAVHHEPVGPGGAELLDQLGALLGQPAVRAVRARAARAGVVLVVADGFYDTVVRAHPETVDPATYRPIPAPDGTHRSWIHVPGYPSPPGLHAEQSQVRPATPSVRQGGVSFVNHGPVSGPQVGGDLHVEGDWVHGNKHVYGEAGRG